MPISDYGHTGYQDIVFARDFAKLRNTHFQGRTSDCPGHISITPPPNHFKLKIWAIRHAFQVLTNLQPTIVHFHYLKFSMDGEVGKCTDNPRVFCGQPVPVPATTRTCVPMGMGTRV